MLSTIDIVLYQTIDFLYIQQKQTFIILHYEFGRLRIKFRNILHGGNTNILLPFPKEWNTCVLRERE